MGCIELCISDNSILYIHYIELNGQGTQTIHECQLENVMHMIHSAVFANCNAVMPNTVLHVPGTFLLISTMLSTAL